MTPAQLAGLADVHSGNRDRSAEEEALAERALRRR